MDLPPTTLSPHADVGDLQRSIANLGFPSPASEDISLTTPGAERPLLSEFDHRLPTWTTDDGQSTLIATVPRPVRLGHVVTPMEEGPPSLSMDAVVGAAIDPAPTHNVSASLVDISPPCRVGRELRLPPFDVLGIANPHPDCFRQPSIVDISPISIGGGSASEETSTATQVSPGEIMSETQARASIQQYITPLTPPDDSATPPTWGSIVQVNTASTNPAVIESDVTTKETSSIQPTAQSSQQTESSSTLGPRIQIQRSDSDVQRSSWLDESTEVMMKSVYSSSASNGPIKVLSHALPCPSTTGFAFPKIIESLHTLAPGTPTHWINVFHALPGRYNLADLPTSPPGTPGPAVGGDDYFTTKVFDSAVPVLDYQDSLTTLPGTPRPVVPPSSINVSIVERYIPPTNTNEFSELFDINGRSLLRDRLIELAPDSGTLLFIYPTKLGAKTFMNQYLSPILDPLLRSMCIINELSVDLGSDLGRMSAVDAMPSFETMGRNIQRLCHDLSADKAHTARYSGAKAQYSLLFAAKEKVPLERTVWAENWWIKQEKPRVREVLSKYFRIARKLPGDSDVTPTSLIHEVLDGVAARPYGRASPPTEGVEVGVFVIKRTA